MPLEAGAKPGSPGFSRNVATEVKAGKPTKQAVAIAYSKARGDALQPSPFAGPAEMRAEKMDLEARADALVGRCDVYKGNPAEDGIRAAKEDDRRRFEELRTAVYAAKSPKERKAASEAFNAFHGDNETRTDALCARADAVGSKPYNAVFKAGKSGNKDAKNPFTGEEARDFENGLNAGLRKS